MYLVTEILMSKGINIKRLVGPLAATAILLSGCGESKPSSSPPTVKSVNEVPNFSKLTKGGLLLCKLPLKKKTRNSRSKFEILGKLFLRSQIT